MTEQLNAKLRYGLARFIVENRLSISSELTNQLARNLEGLIEESARKLAAELRKDFGAPQ